MKNILHAEFYKWKRNWPFWCCVALFYLGTGFYYGSGEAEIFQAYRGLELFGLPPFAWMPYCFAIAIVTGLAIGEDFTTGTIRNALAVGVARRDYYFARLAVQLMMAAVCFTLGQSAYIICRIAHPAAASGQAVPLLWAKLSAYSITALLQLLAYVSILNAVCYFVKKQIAAMVAGMVLVYLEAIVRQLAEVGSLETLQRFVQYMPARVLYRMFNLAVYDQVFTLDFLGYVLSAFSIIAVSSIAGYLKFILADDIT